MYCVQCSDVSKNLFDQVLTETDDNRCRSSVDTDNNIWGVMSNIEIDSDLKL